VVVLKREVAQLDQANAILARCAQFYARLKAGLQRR
jgi:hypothetical protein